MRQVKRKRPTNIRSELKRAQGRDAKRAAAKPFGKRKQPPRSLWARIGGAVAGLFSWRRPILLLTSLSTLAVLFAGIAISGAVDRGWTRLDKAMVEGVRAAGFTVARIAVSGNRRTPAESVRAALGAKAGASMFGFDIYAARERILRLPWVAKAEVRRRYPGDLEVRIVEKHPFARWQGPRGVYVVTREGGLITKHGVEAFHALPLLAGEGAPGRADRILATIARHPEVARHIAVYQYQSGRRWNLILTDGVVVKLPEEGWADQIGDLAQLIVKKKFLDYDVTEIDLRGDSHYFVRKAGRKPDTAKSENGRAI